MASSTPYWKQCIAASRFYRTSLKWTYLALCPILAFTPGCGGGASGSGGAPQLMPDFSITLQPPSVAVALGTSQNLSIQLTPLHGFAGQVSVTVVGLPAGVSAAPLTITVSTSSATGTLQLTADVTAPIGSASATLQAVAGAVKHTQMFTITTVRTGSSALAFTTLGGGVVRGFYDPQQQLLFVSNLLLNEVDILSAANLSLVKRLSIPQPVGLDQMPDGHTIIVGTMTQGVYMIDESSLVAQRFLLPNISTISTAVPLIPAAMANGKVLFIAQDLGVFHNYYLGGFICEWDPVANTFQTLSLPGGLTGPPEAEHIARSADHQFAIFDLFGGQLYLYSSATDSLFSINNNSFAGDVAANSDGSQFVESVNGAINFYDRNLNLVASVPLTPSSVSTALLAPNYGMQYSPDNSRLYVQVTNATLSPVTVIDTSKFTQLGFVPTYYRNAGTPGHLVAADNSQNVFIATSGGVGLVQASQPTFNLISYQLQPLSAEPDSTPLGVSSTATFGGSGVPQDTAVKFGSLLGSIQSSSSGQVVVDVPSSAIPGPADVVFSLPDGTAFVFPQDFSYGVNASALSANFSAAQVSTPLSLLGFGLVPQNQPPRITFSGADAPHVDITGYGVAPNSLEKIKVATPVQPIGTVDVTVTNFNGSSTLGGSMTYLQTVSVAAAPGISHLLFDPHRNVLYAAHAGQVDVLDPVALQWKPGLQPPGALPNSIFTYIALTPDGSKMVAVDTVNAIVSVFDPSNPTSGQSVSLRNPNVPDPPPPPSLPFIVPYDAAVTSTGKVFMGIVGWDPAELDLNSMTFLFRSDLRAFSNGAVFRASSDGTQLAAVSIGNSGGGVAVWDAVADTFKSQGYQQFWDDVAVSPTGAIGTISIDQLAPDDVTYFLDQQLHYVGTPGYPDLAPPLTRAVWGVQFSPQGTLFLIPRQDSIDFVDVATGRLRARYATPEDLVTPQNVASIKVDLAVDPSGQKLFAISASGLLAIEFPTPIDSIPQANWPF